MKDEFGGRHRRVWAGRRGERRGRLGDISAHATGAAAPEPVAPPARPCDLAPKFPRATLAFRGYDVSNLGRSDELLAHPAYGPVVRRTLNEVSEVASEALHRPVDLVERVEAQEPSTLASFPDDVALIVGMEMAQVRVLDEVFGLPATEARRMLGYSIGELTAAIVGGVYALDQLLPVPLELAPDCAELAVDTTMGVLFTRGPFLEEEIVYRVCRLISAEGRGLIGPSAFLSPNTALILGEGGTLDRLEAMLPDHFPSRTMLRRNPNRWPPLHSPIVWERNITNRAAMLMYKIKGGSTCPTPAIISCVTGKADYGPDNSRDLMIRWTDQPQRLWDAIDTLLNSGVETVIHVGPSPNLIPATFGRLSNNVTKHLQNRHLQRLGNNVVSTMAKHAWLSHALPAKACLLRTPFIEHIILEDWLLAQPAA